MLLKYMHDSNPFPDTEPPFASYTRAPFIHSPYTNEEEGLNIMQNDYY